MNDCGHALDGESSGVCTHVLDGAPYLDCFTGRGTNHDLLCKACLDQPLDRALTAQCRACRDRIRRDNDYEGHVGAPAIVHEPSTLRLEHGPAQSFTIPPLLDARPLLGGDRDRWIALARDGELFELDLDRREVRRLATIPDSLRVLTPHPEQQDAPDEPPPLTLYVSRDGRLAAVMQEDYGLAGLVIDLETGAHLLALTRDHHDPEHCRHSFAFFEHDNRTLIVHASDWNRLDIRDPRTGELLTPRGPTSYAHGEERPEHDLDYFHCGLSVSPDQRRIVDNGWVWHPDGMVVAWRLDAWLTNVWESEDGPTRKTLCWRGEWDRPLCWIDDTRVALWGYGQDQQLIPAVRIFDVDAAVEQSWFAGPTGELVFDRVLMSIDERDGLSVWNVERGTRLLHDPRPTSRRRYHPTAKTFLHLDDQLRSSRLVGLDAALTTGVIAELVERIARERAFEDLPVLGDALEAAGCTDREMLAHCQQPGEHGDRCWVIDRLTR